MPEHSLQPLYTSERVVVQLFRLFRLARMHDLGNEAVGRALDEAHALLREGSDELGGQIDILFTSEAVFVCGQLLRASRTGYDLAMELGAKLLSLRVNMVSVRDDVSLDDLRGVMAAFAAFEAGGGVGERPCVGGFAMRLVDASIRLDDEEGVESQLVSTYSYAVVGMRRLFEEIKDGRYVFTRFVKRALQRLIQLADRAPEMFVGLVNYRTAHNDESGRAINAAVMAIAMGRQISRDNTFLSRLGMAAILFDAGLPRAAGMGHPDPDRLTSAIPRLTRDQRRTIPASNALVQIALSRMHGDAEERTVIGYESNWLAARKLLPVLYAGEQAPALESVIVATVYRFIQLTTFDVWVEKVASLDDALHALRIEAQGEVERDVVELLVRSLGIYARGDTVELTSGWMGVVEQAGRPRRGFRRAKVRLLVDPEGGFHKGISVDLAADESYGFIRELVSEPAEPFVSEAREIVAAARLARATGETASPRPGSAPATPLTPTTPKPRDAAAEGATEPAPKKELVAPSAMASEPEGQLSDVVVRASRSADLHAVSAPSVEVDAPNVTTEPDATPAASVLATPRRFRRGPDRTPAPALESVGAPAREDTPESIGDAAAAAMLGADYERVGSGSSIAVHSGSFRAVRTEELERVPSGVGFKAVGPRVSTAVRAALDRSGARLMESELPARDPVATEVSRPEQAPAARAQSPRRQAPRAAVMKRRRTQDVHAVPPPRAEDTSPDPAPSSAAPEGAESTPVPTWDALPLPRVDLTDFIADEHPADDEPLVPREDPLPEGNVSGSHAAVRQRGSSRRGSRDYPAVGRAALPRSTHFNRD